MTLERHRSKLIPDVNYSLDGTLFVTDREGTFPLSGKSKPRQDVRDLDYNDRQSEGHYSYRSYDPHRDQHKRKYKQRSSPNRYSQEIQNISGTISTHSSSLGRRLRRSKRRFSTTSYPRRQSGDGRYSGLQNGGSGPHSYAGSTGGGSTGRRLRTGPPKMPEEFAATIREKEARRSQRRRERDSFALRKVLESPIENGGSIRGYSPKASIRGSKDFGKYPVDYSSMNGKSFLDKDYQLKSRKIHDESLPFLVFLVVGSLLVVIGIVRVIASHWHEYLGALWAGLLVSDMLR